MLLKLAFGAFGHARVYVAIRPDNTPSLRLFARMGFTNDDGDEARSCTEAADEVSMSLDREAFARLHADALGAIREAAP
jgi:RimJ/RimL family protein N-acetyltransferase